MLAVSAVVRAVAGKPRKIALRGYRRCNVVVLRSFDDEAVVSAAAVYHFFQFFLAEICLSALKNRIAEIALVCPYIHVYSFSGGSEIVLLPFYHKNKLLSIALAVNCFIWRFLSSASTGFTKLLDKALSIWYNIINRRR